MGILEKLMVPTENVNTFCMATDILITIIKITDYRSTLRFYIPVYIIKL